MCLALSSACASAHGVILTSPVPGAVVTLCTIDDTAGLRGGPRQCATGLLLCVAQAPLESGLGADGGSLLGPAPCGPGNGSQGLCCGRRQNDQVVDAVQIITAGQLAKADSGSCVCICAHVWVYSQSFLRGCWGQEGTSQVVAGGQLQAEQLLGSQDGWAQGTA